MLIRERCRHKRPLLIYQLRRQTEVTIIHRQNSQNQSWWKTLLSNQCFRLRRWKTLRWNLDFRWSRLKMLRWNLDCRWSRWKMLRSNLVCNIESLIPSMLFSDSGLRRRQWRSGNLIDFIKSIFWSNYSYWFFDQGNFKSIFFGKLPIQILILIPNPKCINSFVDSMTIWCAFKN